MRTIQYLFLPVAIAVSLFIISCGDGENNLSPETQPSLSFSGLAWSSNGVLAFRDNGTRKIQNNWGFIDTLSGIWTYNISSGERSRVVAFGDGPSWSPDGSKFSFRYSSSIWIYDLETKSSKLVAQSGRYTNPASWSPCGDLLVYVSSLNAPFDYTIWSYRISTGENQNITPEEGGFRNPTWYAGCDSILYRKYISENDQIRTKIMMMSSSGENPHLLFNSGFYDVRKVASSPDGQYVSFHVGDQSGNKLSIYNLQTQQYYSELRIEGNDASWSPDGSSVVFVRPFESNNSMLNSEIIVLDIETNIFTKLF